MVCFMVLEMVWGLAMAVIRQMMMASSWMLLGAKLYSASIKFGSTLFFLVEFQFVCTKAYDIFLYWVCPRSKAYRVDCLLSHINSLVSNPYMDCQCMSRCLVALKISNCRHAAQANLGKSSSFFDRSVLYLNTKISADIHVIFSRVLNKSGNLGGMSTMTYSKLGQMQQKYLQMFL